MRYMNVYKLLHNPVEAGYKMLNLFMVVGIYFVYVCMILTHVVKGDIKYQSCFFLGIS